MVIKNNQSGCVTLKQEKDTGLKLKKSIPRVRQVGLWEQQLPEQEGAQLCVPRAWTLHSPPLSVAPLCCFRRAGTLAQAGCRRPSTGKSTYRVMSSSLCAV